MFAFFFAVLGGIAVPEDDAMLTAADAREVVVIQVILTDIDRRLD